MALYPCPECGNDGIDGGKDRVWFICNVCSSKVPAEEVAHVVTEIGRNKN